MKEDALQSVGIGIESKNETRICSMCSVLFIFVVLLFLDVFVAMCVLVYLVYASANGNGEADRIINNENYRCSKY